MLVMEFSGLDVIGEMWEPVPFCAIFGDEPMELLLPQPFLPLILSLCKSNTIFGVLLGELIDFVQHETVFVFTWVILDFFEGLYVERAIICDLLSVFMRFRMAWPFEGGLLRPLSIFCAPFAFILGVGVKFHAWRSPDAGRVELHVGLKYLFNDRGRLYVGVLVFCIPCLGSFDPGTLTFTPLGGFSLADSFHCGFVVPLLVVFLLLFRKQVSWYLPLLCFRHFGSEIQTSRFH